MKKYRIGLRPIWRKDKVTAGLFLCSYQNNTDNNNNTVEYGSILAYEEDFVTKHSPVGLHVVPGPRDTVALVRNA